MQIVPHLWYSHEAVEAAQLYTSIIDNSAINWRYTIKNTPDHEAELVEFTLANLTFAAISAGDYFRLNESISLMLSCSTEAEVRRIYGILKEGGQELMPLDKYDFCPLYVWIADRYGLNWQIMLNTEQATKHHIDLCLLFDQEQSGKAHDALTQYSQLFTQAQLGKISYYDGTQPDKRAKINYGELIFDNFKLVAMDHGYGGRVTFNEAFSLMILCDTDEETHRYQNALSHVEEAEQCGWLKDQYGVSWQVVPRLLMQCYDTLDEATLEKLNKAVMQMKRLTVESIQRIITEK